VGKDSTNVGETLAEQDDAKQTLSQFMARVLNQLALSAWLPSAALVLSSALLIQLGETLATPSGPGTSTAPLDELATSAARLGQTSIGGALVMIAAIVVLTVLTQAFSFEAIRTLEGYWGTWAPIEWLAGHRRKHYSKRRQSLDQSYDDLTARAWKEVRSGMERSQAAILASSPPASFASPIGKWADARKRRRQRQPDCDGAIYTPNVLAIVEARVLGNDLAFEPTEWEREVAKGIAWQALADPEHMRRRVNLDKKRRDYPASGRTLPTRVGNILRAHEDDTEQPDVESFVQRVFHDLPPSLQAEHDEQRTRLDLYCSLVFMTLFMTLLWVARLWVFGIWWALGAAAVWAVASWVMYKAAQGSARAFGNVLTVIAGYVRDLH
jgi:hypothetical protein